METVFLTGGNGFTGRHILQLLRKKGFNVIAPSQTECNILDPSSISKYLSQYKVDYVIHLAGISFVGEQDTSLFYKTNTIGSENLVKVLAGLNYPIKKIIVASSATVYGNAGSGLVKENHPTNPVNHYGCSKLSMEYMLNFWSKKLPIIIVRPFNYTGPHHSNCFVVPKIVWHFAKKIPTISLGNMDVIREVNSIDFVTESYYRLLVSKEVVNGIFNICSGKGYSIMDILNLLKDMTGFKINFLQDALLKRSAEIHSLVGCNKKFTNYLGMVNKISLDQSLMEMYRFVKNQP